jgi:hypothetical protein
MGLITTKQVGNCVASMEHLDNRVDHILERCHLCSREVYQDSGHIFGSRQQASGVTYGASLQLLC